MSVRRGAFAVAALVLLAACNPAQPWRSDLVSRSLDGAGGNGRSGLFAVSPDGNLVAFTSSATDLVAEGSTYTRDNVFLLDRATQAITRLSESPDGTDGGTFDSRVTRDGFSPDGSKVLFVSEATNLGPAEVDQNNSNDAINGPATDVFVRDLESGTTEVVSLAVGGTATANSDSMEPVWSPDGTKVAFRSFASDLTAATTTRGDFLSDVYVRDLTTGETTLVSADPSGTRGGDDTSSLPVFSPDGTKIAFVSRADDLAGPPTGSDFEVFVRDLSTNVTTMASVNAAGDGGGAVFLDDRPLFLDDVTVVFASGAPDLVAGTTTSGVNVFARNLETGVTRLLVPNGGGSSFPLALSRDGRLLAFENLGGAFGDEPVSNHSQVYVMDLLTGGVRLASVDVHGSAAGNQSYDRSYEVAFSADGRRLAFGSYATNLVPVDTNGQLDVFVRDLERGTTQLVSANASGQDSAAGQSWGPAFAGDDIVFASDAGDLGPPDAGRDHDVYIAHLTGADLVLEASASPEPVASGAEMTYSVTVENRGPEAAGEPVVAVLAPEGTTLVSATSSTACAPDPATPRLMLCPAGDLPAGGTLEVEVVVRVDAPAGTVLTAVAGASSSTLDPVGPGSLVLTSTVAP
jgi:uncharacterized repeat protein (TIGR01451 family)